MAENSSEVGEIKNIPVKSFETERGSIYTYDDEGKVTRCKTIKDELHKKDLTVFVKLDPKDYIRVSGAIESDDLGVYVVEIGDNGKADYIYSREDVKNVDKLRFVVINIHQNECVFSRKASLTPEIGDVVYEVDKPDKEKGTFMRHLGHRVTKINY